MQDILDAINQFNINLDITTIIGMLAVGFLIKHTPTFKKISNNIIPPLIVVLCIIIGFLKLDTYTGEAICTMFLEYIINAAVAVGFHQYGKNTFKSFKAFLNTYKQSQK